jgi:hypothetical protein
MSASQRYFTAGERVSMIVTTRRARLLNGWLGGSDVQVHTPIILTASA